MRKIQAKQIHRLFQSTIPVAGVAGTLAANSITANLATAVVGAGWRNVDVPNQVYVAPTYPLTNPAGLDTEKPGWRISGDNIVEIWVAGTQERVIASNGEEVYGRLTAGTGTINLYTIEGSTETAYALEKAVTLDLGVPYVFTLDTLPLNPFKGSSAKLSQDPSTGKVYVIKDITGLFNVSTQIAAASIPLVLQTGSSDAVINVNGQVHELVNGAFSITGKDVTWLPLIAGFKIDATDTVTIRYEV